MSGILEDGAAIEAALHCGVHVTVYQSIDSTNAELRRRCCGAEAVHAIDRTVIIARSQSSGRGRLGRAFVSPAGTGLYLSILHSPPCGIATPQTLTAIAAVAVCRAIGKVYNKAAGIKWVNDVFMRGRKVAGILTEAVADGAVANDTVEAAIIGIGVNVLPGALPAGLSSVAGSVLEDSSDDPHLNEFAAAVIGELFDMLDKGRDGLQQAEREKDKAVLDIISEYRALSIIIGKQVVVSPLVDEAGETGGNPYIATVVDIDKDAALIVRTTDGIEHTLHSGEVTIGSGMVSSALSAALSSAGGYYV